jgi:hypothetical protein
MEMNAVIASFRDLCDNPVAWVILAGISLKAALSLAYFLSCPYCRSTLDVTPDQARALLARRTIHDPRFLVAMTTALTLTIGGLYAAQSPDLATFALAAILIGVFIMLVAPSQLWITDGTLRVAAARADGSEALSFAADRLRWAHLERIAIEIAFALALAVLILSF